MGNQNLNPSASGFGLFTTTKFKNTRDWLDKTKWDQRILEDMAEKKEVAPFERPTTLSKEDEELLNEQPEEAREKFGPLEKCPLCLLYFKRGLNECTNCGEKVCSHCYFRVKSPPFIAPQSMTNDYGEEIVKEGDLIDDSECIICLNNPWKVIYGSSKEKKDDEEEGEKEKPVDEKVLKQKKAFKDQQKQALEHFQKRLEQKKKSKKKSKKKKPTTSPSVKSRTNKKKNEEKEEEEEGEGESTKGEDDEQRIMEQIEKMIPSDLDIDDIVETEAKMIEEALERELAESGEIPEMESDEYKKIKKSVNMAMYGTLKRLKVEELRKIFEPKSQDKEKIIEEQGEEKETGLGEEFEESYFDFLL